MQISQRMVPSDDFEISLGINTNQALSRLDEGHSLASVLRECACPATSLIAAAYAIRRGDCFCSWRTLLLSVRGIGPMRYKLWSAALLKEGVDPQAAVCASEARIQREVADLLVGCSQQINSGVNTMHRAVRENSNQQDWLLCREIAWRVPDSYGGRRRADLLAFKVDSGERVAYEFKIARSDLEKELRRPDKSAPAMFIAERFFIVTPPGLAKGQRLKSEMGLIEVDLESQELVQLIASPKREVLPPPQELLEGLSRWALSASAGDARKAKHFIERFGRGAPSLASFKP